MLGHISKFGTKTPRNKLMEIFEDSEDLFEKMKSWISKNDYLFVNEKYSQIWPNITSKKEPPVDAKDWEGVENKFEKYFSEKGAE